MDEVNNGDIDSDALENSIEQETPAEIIETNDSLNTSNASKSPTQKHRFRLPLSRVKQMMKMDPDVNLISQDSIILVAKATEMFIELLAKEAGKQLASNKRKTVMKRDIDIVIESLPQLCFLDGALE